MQQFFEQVAGIVNASLQWLDEERGIEAQGVQELEVHGDFCLPEGQLTSPYAPFIWTVEVAD